MTCPGSLRWSSRWNPQNREWNHPHALGPSLRLKPLKACGRSLPHPQSVRAAASGQSELLLHLPFDQLDHYAHPLAGLIDDVRVYRGALKEDPVLGLSSRQTH